MCLGSVIETLNSLAESRVYNYILISLIPTFAYIVKTLPFYFYNPRAFFGFNKKCVLWLVGLLTVFTACNAILLYMYWAYDDCMAIADQVQARETSLGWQRYIPVVILLWGYAGCYFSMSESFRTDITVEKRIILSCICLFPVLCAIFFLNEATRIDVSLVIKFCLKASIPYWVLSSKTIFTGQTLIKYPFTLIEEMLLKLAT